LDVAIPGFDQHEKIDPFIVGFAMDDVRHLNIFRRDLNPGFFVRFADDFFFQRGLGGDDLLQTMVTFQSKVVFAVGQPGLRKGVEFAGEGEPIWWGVFFHLVPDLCDTYDAGTN
jgi:hypothetical protein